MTQHGLDEEKQPPVVDVAMISDFRLPGGTTSSIAEEVRAQSEAGMTTALIHAAGTVTTYPNPWSAHIRSVLGLPGVRIASPRSRLHARALIVRHPTVIASTPSTFEGITTDHVIVVVNHAAIDAAGVHHYDVESTDARVRLLFGLDKNEQDPVWAPIGPVVRRTVEQQTRRIPLREKDWLNIFRMPHGAPQRAGFLGERPVLGRHSRPQPGKWPASKADILSAYPDSEVYQVEILGGAQIAEKLIGRVPQHWNVVPFGGEDPWEFLKRIDFWVYMHHPDLKEAFGRAAMEALAAGCVAIMPPYMGELFGDAAVYGEPKDVTRIVDSFWQDPQSFLAQSRRAQEFAAAYNPQMHIRRLEEFGIRPETQGDARGHSEDAWSGNLAEFDQESSPGTTMPGETAETLNAAEGHEGPAGSHRSERTSARHLHGLAVAGTSPQETSWHQTLEQWASSYYGAERMTARGTMDFAPQKAPIPKHFYDLSVLLVVMTRDRAELHAALCEGLERLREATYGFRAVAFTDSLSAPGLRSMDWAVEQCYAEEDWHALSSRNWLTYAAEQLMWTQQHYGASTVIAPDSLAGLNAALAHVAEVFEAPATVLSAAQQTATEMVEQSRVESQQVEGRQDSQEQGYPRASRQRTGSAPLLGPVRSPRGLFADLPMGESALLPATGSQHGSISHGPIQDGLITAVRRPDAYGAILAPRTSAIEQLLGALSDLPMNQVLIDSQILGGAEPSAPGKGPGGQGLLFPSRLLRAAAEVLSEYGPVLLVADGLPEGAVAAAEAQALLYTCAAGHIDPAEDGGADKPELAEPGPPAVQIVLDYGPVVDTPAAELSDVLRTVQEVHARSVVEQLQPGAVGQGLDGEQPTADQSHSGQPRPVGTESTAHIGGSA